MQTQREGNSEGSHAADVGRGSINETSAQPEKPSVTSANGKDTIARSASPRQSHNSSLGTNVTSTGQKAGWFADIQLGDQETLTFKLDKGAEVTAISDSAYKSLSHPPPLNTIDRVLFGASHQPLEVKGQCSCHLSFKGRESLQKYLQ